MARHHRKARASWLAKNLWPHGVTDLWPVRSQLIRDTAHQNKAIDGALHDDHAHLLLLTITIVC